jgi:hypothetical protein
MEVRPVGVKLLRTDGHTDLAEIMDAICNFANVPKN